MSFSLLTITIKQISHSWTVFYGPKILHSHEAFLNASVYLDNQMSSYWWFYPITPCWKLKLFYLWYWYLMLHISSANLTILYFMLFLISLCCFWKFQQPKCRWEMDLSFSEGQKMTSWSPIWGGSSGQVLMHKKKKLALQTSLQRSDGK